MVPSIAGYACDALMIRLSRAHVNGHPAVWAGG
jgi:hypothetical protein